MSRKQHQLQSDLEVSAIDWAAIKIHERIDSILKKVA